MEGHLGLASDHINCIDNQNHIWWFRNFRMYRSGPVTKPNFVACLLTMLSVEKRSKTVKQETNLYTCCKTGLQ